MSHVGLRIKLVKPVGKYKFEGKNILVLGCRVKDIKKLRTDSHSSSTVLKGRFSFFVYFILPLNKHFTDILIFVAQSTTIVSAQDTKN